MNHYEVLGVADDIDAVELRRAYLQLARRHHPDRVADADEADRATAAVRMQEVNAAWNVLGDPARRAAYDRQLAAATGRSDVSGSAALRSSVQRPSSDFTPYWEHDEDDDDSWRYEPDEVNPDTVPPKLLLAAPAASFVLGVALLAASAPTGIRALTASGLVLLGLSALLFVGAPVVALFKSQITEDRAARRRR
ncbi:MAG: J domain-containing protein [Microthrixaceae bacterium]